MERTHFVHNHVLMDCVCKLLKPSRAATWSFFHQHGVAWLRAYSHGFVHYATKPLAADTTAIADSTEGSVPNTAGAWALHVPDGCEGKARPSGAGSPRALARCSPSPGAASLHPHAAAAGLAARLHASPSSSSRQRALPRPRANRLDRVRPLTATPRLPVNDLQLDLARADVFVRFFSQTLPSHPPRRRPGRSIFFKSGTRGKTGATSGNFCLGVKPE